MRVHGWVGTWELMCDSYFFVPYCVIKALTLHKKMCLKSNCIKPLLIKGYPTDSASLKKMATLYSIHVWKMSAVVFSLGLCQSVSFSPLCYGCAQAAFLLSLSVTRSYARSPNANSSAAFFLALQNPTALAKILGVFRIGFRNTRTNSALKQDLLVMENLFYNRKISQVQLQAHQKNIWCWCIC